MTSEIEVEAGRARGLARSVVGVVQGCGVGTLADDLCVARGATEVSMGTIGDSREVARWRFAIQRRRGGDEQRLMTWYADTQRGLEAALDRVKALVMNCSSELPHRIVISRIDVTAAHERVEETAEDTRQDAIAKIGTRKR